MNQSEISTLLHGVHTHTQYPLACTDDMTIPAIYARYFCNMGMKFQT